MVPVAIGCRWEGSGAWPQFFGTVLDSAASAVFDRRVAVEPLAASSKFRGYTVFVYFQRAFRTELRTDLSVPYQSTRPYNRYEWSCMAVQRMRSDGLGIKPGTKRCEE